MCTLNTIALVCSPNIGNDRQPWKQLIELKKITYPVKTLEQFNAMRAIIYSREFIGYIFELSYVINLGIACSCFA